VSYVEGANLVKQTTASPTAKSPSPSTPPPTTTTTQGQSQTGRTRSSTVSGSIPNKTNISQNSSPVGTANKNAQSTSQQSTNTTPNKGENVVKVLKPPTSPFKQPPSPSQNNQK
jgi:hypothetical protein